MQNFNVTSPTTDVSGNQASWFTVDPTRAPQVESIRPDSSNLQVPLNSNIVITFSHPILISTVNATGIHISTSGVIEAGTFSSPNPYTVVFTPDANLQQNAVYEVEVANSVTNAIGNAVTPYSSSFRTIQGPTPAGSLIASVEKSCRHSKDPAVDATNVKVSLTSPGKTFGPVSPNDMGYFRFVDIPVGTYNMEFQADGYSVAPESAASLSVDIENGIQTDLTADPVILVPSVAFDTDRTEPVNFASGVKPDTQVRVFFSHQIDPTTVPGNLILQEAGMGVNLATPAPDGDFGWHLTLLPPNELKEGKNYEIIATTGLRNKAGAALPDTKIYGFSTHPPAGKISGSFAALPHAVNLELRSEDELFQMTRQLDNTLVAFSFVQVPPGTYSLRIKPADGYSIYPADDPGTFHLAAGASVAFAGGWNVSATYPEINPPLATAAGKLAFSAQRFDGDTKVFADNTQLTRVATTTTGNMWAEVSTLPPGEYSVRLENSDGSRSKTAQTLQLGLMRPIISSVTAGANSLTVTWS